MRYKSIYIILAAFTIMAVTSCKKDLAKANINPDGVLADQYDPNLLLTTVQLSYTGSTNFGGSVWATKWGGAAMFMQHTASTNAGFYYGDKYLNNMGAMGEMMQDNYVSAVQPAVELYHLTANKKQYRNLHQMARIMKAMIFEQITDLYGDIPYFQAGLGHFNDIYEPKYDTQKDIYTDLLKEVSEATDSLTESGDMPTGDVLYYGYDDQIAQWKMFGNSLLLRMAMRLTKVDPTTAQTYVAKVYGHTLQSNADNAIIQHQDGLAVTQNRDALQLFGNDTTDFRLSSTYISNMKKNHDPRLGVVAWLFLADVDDDGDVIDTHPNADPSVAQGLPNGYLLGGNNAAIDVSKQDSFPKIKGRAGIAGYSTINDNILNTSAPDLILTYSETELLFADAVVRWPALASKIKIGSAASHYNNGVIAAITQLSAYGDAATIDESDADDYLTAHPYLGDNAAGLSQINMQYWLCTLMDEYECYANWRRSGDLPHLTPVNYPGNGTGGTIPRRMTYPPSQKITNGANYNAAVARLQGGDKMTSRIWWDIVPKP